MLDCLCFRGLINKDARESENLEGELAVPVNFLLFWGASIGGASDARVGGGMAASDIRGTGSDSSEVSIGDIQMVAGGAVQLKNRPSAVEESLEVPSEENEREPISKVSSSNLGTCAPLASREVPK